MTEKLQYAGEYVVERAVLFTSEGVEVDIKNLIISLPNDSNIISRYNFIKKGNLTSLGWDADIFMHLVLNICT